MRRCGLHMDGRSRTTIIVMAILIILSLFVLRPVLSSVDTWKNEMRTLDSKRGTVLQLLGASSAASAVITLIPDDVGTPIADQLADLSVVFMAILAVLMAEKYMLPLLGGFTTALLIPTICVLYSLYCVKRENKWLLTIAFKLTVLAIAFLTLIPLSVGISNTIDRTFEVSINETINAALESNDELNVTEETEKNLWQKITGAVSGALDYVGKAVDIAKKVLGNFVEAATVLLVTSCIIPIVVLLAYIMIIKYVFSLDFSILNLPDRVLPSRRLKRIVGEDEHTGEK